MRACNAAGDSDWSEVLEWLPPRAPEIHDAQLHVAHQGATACERAVTFAVSAAAAVPCAVCLVACGGRQVLASKCGARWRADLPSAAQEVAIQIQAANAVGWSCQELSLSAGGELEPWVPLDRTSLLEWERLWEKELEAREVGEGCKSGVIYMYI